MGRRSWRWVARRYGWERDGAEVEGVLRERRGAVGSRAMVEALLGEVFEALLHADVFVKQKSRRWIMKKRVTWVRKEQK